MPALPAIPAISEETKKAPKRTGVSGCCLHIEFRQNPRRVVAFMVSISDHYSVQNRPGIVHCIGLVGRDALSECRRWAEPAGQAPQRVGVRYQPVLQCPVLDPHMDIRRVQLAKGPLDFRSKPPRTIRAVLTVQQENDVCRATLSEYLDSIQRLASYLSACRPGLQIGVHGPQDITRYVQFREKPLQGIRFTLAVNDDSDLQDSTAPGTARGTSPASRYWDSPTFPSRQSPSIR